jgi:hypothetical protein
VCILHDEVIVDLAGGGSDYQGPTWDNVAELEVQYRNFPAQTKQIRVASLEITIRTQDLPNTKKDCYQEKAVFRNAVHFWG